MDTWRRANIPVGTVLKAWMPFAVLSLFVLALGTSLGETGHQ